jgi:hypothetical protein
MELLFDGNLNDFLWMNTVPFSGFNYARRCASEKFCCGDYCVIPLGGSLQQKLNPARRFAPAGFGGRDYWRDPIGGIPATEIKSRPSLRAGVILQKGRTSSELESCLFAKYRAAPRDLISVAEREGFEPSEPRRVQQFSRLPRSTTPASLHKPVANIQFQIIPDCFKNT